MKNSIIFDLDGTLWDTSKEVEKVWNKVAEEYGLKVTQKQIKHIMGFTEEEIIEYLFERDKNTGKEFIKKCLENENKYLIKNGGHIYQNTIETIKKLSETYDLYIVSNCQSGYIESFLEYYKLGKYFKDFECSGNTGDNKAKNIENVLKRNKIQKTIYVGDTQKDYEAATANNLHFIWAKYGFGNCKNYYKEIEDISNLLNF